MPTGACRHGLVRDGGCARDVYMRLEEDNASYFSWWNVVLAGVGLALALLVYLPLNFVDGGAYLRTAQAWWVHYLVTPFIVASCAIGVSIALTSQALFARNLDQMVGVDRRVADRAVVQDPASGVSVQMPVLQAFMHHNVMVHLVPGALAVVSLLVLATGSLHGADVRTVALSALLMCAILWVLYFSIPIVGFRDGKTYVGWAKLVHVYSNPSPLMLAGHCAFAIACALLIPYFVIRRGPSAGAGTELGAASAVPGISAGPGAGISAGPSAGAELQGGGAGGGKGSALASLSRIAALVKTGTVGAALALPPLP
jgi:hypothetical protein